MNRIIKLFVLLLLSTSLLSAQEGQEENRRVVVITSPSRPAAESTWTLTLLVAHHEPNDVTVFAPHFSDALSLTQLNKTPRFFNPSTGQATSSPSEVRASTVPWAFERWTAVEFRFTLHSPGPVTFEEFTVVTPLWQMQTSPFDLYIQPAQNTTQIQTHRLVWEGAPSSLNVGDNVVFGLRINGWNSANVLPENELFLPPVPPGHILESLPLTPAEQSAGIALRLRLIPLQASAFVLQSRRLSLNTSLFEIPALRIPVSRAAAGTAVEESEPETTAAAAPFPPLSAAMEGNAGLYQKYTAECDAVYADARDLWEKGDFANALAQLRRNERDHPAGVFFAVIRRNAEQSLGFTGAYDEKKGRLPLFKGKTRARPKGRFPSHSAVLTGTIVRRVPNKTGMEIARFREGQPVLLDKQSPEVREGFTVWVRVITNDNNRDSGWVPERSIIFY